MLNLHHIGLCLLLDATGNNLLFLDPPSIISPLPTPDLLLHQKKAILRRDISRKPNQRKHHSQNPTFLESTRPHHEDNPRRVPRSSMFLHARLTIRYLAR